MPETKKIYLAGGCFWGVEAYFSKLPGIVYTQAGYANSIIKNPSYEQVCAGITQSSETVHIEYDPDVITLKTILIHFLEIVNPTTLNKQGNDVGTQYRSGIYYADEKDKLTITQALRKEAVKYSSPIVTEVKKIENFYPAEQYHQKYLDKNPFGYCHINMSKLNKYKRFAKPSPEKIKEQLSDIEYNVTQQNATETPYTGKYDDFFEEGIYVDIVTGEPLFSSTDKFNSGCGWPAFSKPIEKLNIIENEDGSHGMLRTEVRSDIGNSHLGHVFEDGPSAKGGLRYCINSASLRFIPLKDMQKEGYADYLYLFNIKE